eukprot:237052_1
MTVVVAGLVGCICLAGIGANDVANSQAMAVGSGALSLRGSQIIASIFEFAGAALVGQHVSSTVGSKLVDMDQISPQKYAWGMLSAVLSTAIWMFTATFIKMPVSSTHSIIGALMGFQLVINQFDFAQQHWGILGNVAISWIATPFISFVMSVVFMCLLDRWWPLYSNKLLPDTSLATSKALINNGDKNCEIQMNKFQLDTNETKEKMELPSEDESDSDEEFQKKNEIKLVNISAYFFQEITKPQQFKFATIYGLLWSTLILFILAAGPKAISILDDVSWWVFIIIGILSFLFTVFIGYFTEKYFRKWYTNKYYKDNHKIADHKNYTIFVNIDYFALYLVIASASVSFAHGGNDVANVLGPFAQIFEYQKNKELNPNGASIPLWLAACGGIAIAIGYILFGKGVLETVGSKIANVTYQTGFIAQYSAALTVLVCDVLALPVSSSTVIIGSIYGVSFYNTIREDRIRKQLI